MLRHERGCPLTPALSPRGEEEIPDSERTRCEIWARVMGYHRPVSAFNAGKRSEHAERRYFRELGDG